MAAPSIVQNNKASQSTDQASCSVLFPSTPTVGNLAVVFAFASNASNLDMGTLTCADNAATPNTYTDRGQILVTATNNRCVVFTAPIADLVAGGSNPTITVTAPTLTGRWAVFIVEVSGHDTGTYIEKAGAAQSGSMTGGATVYSVLNFTATTAAEQLFLALGGTGHTASRSFAPDSANGWLQLDEYDVQTSVPDVCLIYQSVTSTGTYDPGWTMNAAGSTAGGFAGVSIIGAAGGAGGVPKSTKLCLLGVG